MSLGDHLDELRRRLLLAIALPLPLSILFFAISDILVRVMLRPLWSVLAYHGLPLEVQVLSPPETLMTKLKLSLIAAFVVSVPWVIYQFWKFVAPGLYQQEQRFARLLMPGSAVLTVLGVALLYFVMLPLMLHVLVVVGSGMSLPSMPPNRSEAELRALAHLETSEQIPLRSRAPDDPVAGDVWVRVPEMRLEVAVTEDPDDETSAVRIIEVRPQRDAKIDQTFRLSFVMNFVLFLMLAMVVAFQMPLVILLLGWLGLVPISVLQRNRRYAAGICAVLAAVLTPADVFSMLMMLFPLYGLYELGILLLRFAPADRVREGTVFRSMVARAVRRPDNPKTAAAKSARSVQTAATVARTREEDEFPGERPGERIDEEAPR